jgi:hypothetical protein
MNNKYFIEYPDNKFLLSTQPFDNGNMLYATAQYMFLREQYDECLLLGIGLCSNGKGAFYRSPDNKSNTSVDDYLALCCISYYAYYIYKYSFLGFIDVNAPKYSIAQWMFRFNGFWQHMKLSAGIWVGPIGSLVWAYSVYKACQQPVSNQDSWIQTHLMVITAERGKVSNWLIKKAIEYFYEHKPLPTSRIMTQYIGDDSHPLIKAWEKYK